jgi:hypothetical protein
MHSVNVVVRSREHFEPYYFEPLAIDGIMAALIVMPY